MEHKLNGDLPNQEGRRQLTEDMLRPGPFSSPYTTTIWDSLPKQEQEELLENQRRRMEVQLAMAENEQQMNLPKQEHIENLEDLVPPGNSLDWARRKIAQMPPEERDQISKELDQLSKIHAV